MADWLRSTAQTLPTLALWRGQDVPTSRDPMQSLREYARMAILPEMPSPSRLPSRVSGLNVDLYRCQVVLRDIQAINIMNEEVRKFCDHYLAPQPLIYYHAVHKDDTEGDFTIPAPGFAVPFWPLQGPNGSRRLLKWVKHFPLSTVLCMIELEFSVTARYVLEENCDEECELIRWVTWTNHAGPTAWARSTGLITVFVQPPWVLTQHGLEEFTSCRRFPCEDLARNKPVTEVEGLWAKIWSICARNGSPFFVLTNYHGWAFGAFERKIRASAWVSQVVPWNSSEPTVVECLFYWFLSAVGQRGYLDKVFDKLGLPDEWPDDDDTNEYWADGSLREPFDENEVGHTFSARSASPYPMNWWCPAKSPSTWFCICMRHEHGCRVTLTMKT